MNLPLRISFRATSMRPQNLGLLVNARDSLSAFLKRHKRGDRPPLFSKNQCFRS